MLARRSGGTAFASHTTGEALPAASRRDRAAAALPVARTSCCCAAGRRPDRKLQLQHEPQPEPELKSFGNCRLQLAEALVNGLLSPGAVRRHLAASYSRAVVTPSPLVGREPGVGVCSTVSAATFTCPCLQRSLSRRSLPLRPQHAAACILSSINKYVGRLGPQVSGLRSFCDP